MQTYRLKTNHKSPAHFVIFKHGKVYDRIFEMFVENTSPPSDIRFQIIGEMQDGVSYERLQKLDFCESFGGIVLFSNKFMAAMQAQLKDELLFYPCTIVCEGKSISFNIGYIIKRLTIVNAEKSGFNASNNRFVPITFLTEFSQEFLIARDSHPMGNNAFVVTELCKQMIKKAKLNVKFEAAYLGAK
jgi:hypothetical protein